MNLFDHQKRATDFIISRGGSGALFMEIGTGKTRTVLEVYRRTLERDPDVRMLVVAPISLLEAAWRDEVNQCGLPYEVYNLHEEGFPKDIRDCDADIFTINYEMLMRNEKEIEKMIRGDLDGMAWMCVLDESSKIKNPQSLTAKALLKLSDLFDYRIIMSGTPAPNSEMEYWPQMQFLEKGCLGSSMTNFRNKFFHLENRYTGAVYQGRFTSKAQAAEVFRKCEYRITEEKRKELMEMIAPLSFTVKKKDCLDLPDEVDEKRMIEMSDDQRRAYKSMERTLVLAIKDQVIAAPVALTKLMKLRQITSGFVYNEFGEALETDPNQSTNPEIAVDASNDHPSWKTSPKITELMSILEEAGDQQVIIWIQFHWEQIKICHELLKKYGENSVVTISSMTKDRDGSIRAFKEGGARFLVAHPASAAHGLTFTNCSLQVFFSLDYSLERYIQARGRTHRAGQKNVCTYVHILATGTIDEMILKVLQKKGNSQEIIQEFLARKSSN